MRRITKLLICLSLLLAPAAAVTAALGQEERTRQFIVGPNGGDQTRILVAFAEPSQDSYKLQSMIIDLTSVKNKRDEPSAFVQVDLTSTVRSLTSGEKKQKILVLRWKKSGTEIELKCEGKWVKQSTPSAAAIDKIVEATKAVIESVPLDAKTPTEATLSPELEQKVSSILNALDTEDIACLRSVR